MPRPIIKNYTSRIDGTQLKDFIERSGKDVRDFKESLTQVTFTYKKHYRVRAISSTDGSGLRVQSNRDDGFAIFEELEAILFPKK